jgi:hypothetical protein
MLGQAMTSVRNQTVPPLEHIIGIDYERIGVVANTNRLCSLARAEWLLILADDDLLFPTCLEKLENAPGEGEVVYSEMRVEGEGWPEVGPGPSQGKVAGLPGTALIRTELWNRLGGYRAEHHPEDLDFWNRANDAHAGFRYVPEVLWVYRIGHEHGNISRGTLR